MIILGIDFGKKRIGLAISDPMGIVASPYMTLEHRSLGEDLKTIGEIIKNRKVEKIVMGLPLHMNGSEGPEADAVKNFKKDLEAETRCSVELIDERWTTVCAQRSLLEGNLSREKRKKRVDRVAAQMILQTYLERMRLN